MCDKGHAKAWPLLWRQQVGDSTACSKKAIHVPSRFNLAGAALLLVAFMQVIHGVTPLSTFNGNLTLGVTMGGILRPYDKDSWAPFGSINWRTNLPTNDPCANTGNILLIELWRGYLNGSLATRSGVQVEMALFLPMCQGYRQIILIDSAAISNDLPYQRVFVYCDSCIKAVGSGNLTITNRGPMSNDLDRIMNIDVTMSYKLLLSSVPLAPCPRTAPSEPECGRQGICGFPPVGVELPMLNRVCYCPPGWGDVDCQTRARQLSNGDVVKATVEPGEWKYWQLSVPLPSTRVGATSGKPALLVELIRGGSFASASGPTNTPVDDNVGGNPILFVMPKGINQRNRVPYFNDFRQYADVNAVKLFQNFHYRLLYLDDTALSTTLPAVAITERNRGSSNLARTVEVYVAVYNIKDSSQLPGGRRLPNGTANVSLRVRWNTDGGASGSASTSTLGPSSALCPNDCWGRGICSNSYNPMMKSSYTTSMFEPRAQFMCTCEPGFGGPMCEGTLHHLAISYQNDSDSGVLRPGEWAYFFISMDPNFKGFFTDLTLKWTVQDFNKTASVTDLYNAMLTNTSSEFPQLWDFYDVYDRDIQVFYPELLKDYGVLPLLRNLQYRFGSFGQYFPSLCGFYNSDYIRKSSFTYNLKLVISLGYQPPARTRWFTLFLVFVLVPVSLVSVSIAVFLTYRRRVISRRAVSQNDRGGVAAGNGPRTRVGQEGPEQNIRMPPPPTNPSPPPSSTVPVHIMESFINFKYRAKQEGKRAMRRVDTTGGEPISSGCVDVDQPLAPPVAAPPSTAQPVANGALQCTPDDTPQCAVCLCEYEDGEHITRLPCKHEFHGICIRKWLWTHNTCPICRVSLLSEPPQEQPSQVASTSGAVFVGPPPPLHVIQLTAPQSMATRSHTDVTLALH